MKEAAGYWLALWIASFVFFAGNLATWTTRNMTNDYYYARRKNGWWTLFWLLWLVVATSVIEKWE